MFFMNKIKPEEHLKTKMSSGFSKIKYFAKTAFFISFFSTKCLYYK